MGIELSAEQIELIAIAFQTGDINQLAQLASQFGLTVPPDAAGAIGGATGGATNGGARQ